MVIKHLVEPTKIKKGLWLTGYQPMTRHSDKRYFKTKRDALAWYNNQDTDLVVAKAHKTWGFYGLCAYPVYEVK